MHDHVGFHTSDCPRRDAPDDRAGAIGPCAKRDRRRRARQFGRRPAGRQRGSRQRRPYRRDPHRGDRHRRQLQDREPAAGRLCRDLHPHRLPVGEARRDRPADVVHRDHQRRVVARPASGVCDGHGRIASRRRARLGVAVGHEPRAAGHDSHREGSVRRRAADRGRHDPDAGRRRNAGDAAADASGARIVEQRQRVHGRRRADSAHRLRRQPDRILFQRRADGRDRLSDQLAAGRGARGRRTDQHDSARRRQHVPRHGLHHRRQRPHAGGQPVAEPR